MDKQMIAIVAIFLTVVGSVTGILGNQINTINAQIIDQGKIVYTVPELKEDIKEMKSDIKTLLINSRSQTNTFIEPINP